MYVYIVIIKKYYGKKYNTGNITIACLHSDLRVTILHWQLVIQTADFNYITYNVL